MTVIHVRKAILTGGGGALGLLLIFKVKLANSLVGTLSLRLDLAALEVFFDELSEDFKDDRFRFGGRGGAAASEFPCL